MLLSLVIINTYYTILTGHGAELSYVFHTEPRDFKFTPEEEILADITSAYWGNFVNTGDPNGSNKRTCDSEAICQVRY